MLTKQNTFFFYKQRDKGNVPLCYPDLKINEIDLKQVNELKVLGVTKISSDENLNWKSCMALILNKVSKNIW